MEDVGYEDENVDEDADDAPAWGIFDYRLLYSGRAARIVAALNTDSWEAASQAAIALGRHVCAYSPEMLEWQLRSVEAKPLNGPYDGENWLPPVEALSDGQLGIGEYLPQEVIDLGSRCLIVGTVRNLWDRGERTHWAGPFPLSG